MKYEGIFVLINHHSTVTSFDPFACRLLALVYRHFYLHNNKLSATIIP